MNMYDKIINATSTLTLAVMCLVSCGDEFNSVQDNSDTPFSIQGYLESPTDTNWVRISEVRNKLYLEEDAILDATVTLEHLESGEVVTMEDSLFQIEEEYYAYNFWSTMSLEPEQSYLLTVERSDGETSSAKVTMPETFPEPEINASYYIGGKIHEVEYLVAVDIHYTVRNDRNGQIKVFQFSHRHHTFSINFENGDELPSDEHNILIDDSADRATITEFYKRGDSVIDHTYLSRSMYIASAGPDWVDFPSLDPLVKELPEIGNVENGVGFLGGVVSRTFPMPCDFCEENPNDVE